MTQPPPHRGEGTDPLTTAMRQLVLTAVDHGVGPIEASEPWATERLRRYHGDIETAITGALNASVTAAAASGFLTGVGGLLTLPVSLPANVAGSLVINARLVGAIAHLRGHDLHAETVRDLIVVLAGGGPSRLLTELGKRSGVRVATSLLRTVPVIGGLANGAADAGLTVAVGRNAIRSFPTAAMHTPNNSPRSTI